MAQLNDDNKNNNNKEIEKVMEIDSNELSLWIKENNENLGKDNKKYMIIDVRDSDYGPRKIIGSINIPKYKLIDEDKDNKIIISLIEKAKDIENIIFHCRYSMSRGPMSADYYFKFRKDNYSNYPKQSVLVLKGGIAFWEQQHPKLCENI